MTELDAHGQSQHMDENFDGSGERIVPVVGAAFVSGCVPTRNNRRSNMSALGRFLGFATGTAFFFGCGDSPPTGQELSQVAFVTVTPNTLTFTAVGASEQLSAAASDATGSLFTGKTFTWISSDPTVVTVSPSGLATATATAIRDGTAAISATTDTVSGLTQVTVAAAQAQLRVAHTVVGVAAVDVLVGGTVVLSNLAFGEVSAFVPVPAGDREVAFRPAGTTANTLGTVLSFTQDDSVTILTVDSASIINPWVLTDSGAVVPLNKSKLRAVHFADGAPNILAWRTQPDFQTFITIQFPFPHRTATPYIQSDPGTWALLVVTAVFDSAGLPVLSDTLLLVDPIAVPAGESRTVLILDAAGGGLQASVITP